MEIETQVVPSSAQRRERWRNGAGWTREIFSAREHQAAAAPWAWRLSIAAIDAGAPFSTFPGIQREIALLTGNGLRLRFDDGKAVELHPPHDSVRFAGEQAVTGELLDGPATVFNLMWQRETIDAAFWRRPLVGRMLLFADPGTTWAVHLLAGQATIDAARSLPPLAAGDTALLATGSGRTRHSLDGGGEALVMRLARRAVPAGAASQ